MIEFKQLEIPPQCARDRTHHYCDYIELLVLNSDIDGLSTADIYDRFLEDERIPAIGSVEGAGSIDAWSSEIDSWFAELKSREHAYGTYYPFTFHDNRVVLKRELTDYQLVYLGLLLCSSLRYIVDRSKLSSIFEFLSKCAMRQYLPNIAEVHIFGVSSKGEVDYKGSLEDKVRQLAKDMKYEVTSNKKAFRRHDNGDGGVDIIAWVPFEDDINLDKKLIFVGQSAATMDWFPKQHSGRRLKSFLDIEHEIILSFYVPFDMRDASREFQDWSSITTDVMFDRYRLIRLLDPATVFSGPLGEQFKAIIHDAIQFEEDIV
ncbi:hypothetical protein [Pseudidiomarina sp.]|uniref:hypothetical protein n=1 Tax=Pseudidiomarina sp. TaxID=2081707 RepID=UPI003A986CE5